MGRYIEVLKSNIKYNFSQREVKIILDDLKNNNLITYNKKCLEENKTIIYIENSLDCKERLLYALEKSNKVVERIEDYLINKVYRYSIYFKCEDFKKKKEVLKSEEDNYVVFDDIGDSIEKEEFDSRKIVIKENEDVILFRFLIEIEISVHQIKGYPKVYYPTLWIYHKKLKVLEYRFDSIGAENDDDFYDSRMNGQHAKLTKSYDAKIKEYRLAQKIKQIVEEVNEVKETAQSMGLKQNSLAKLKVGTNNVMPLIGDLEEFICDYDALFNANNETEKIKEQLEKFIGGIKRNAKYKARTLTWYEKDKSILDIQVLFDYKGKSYDLLNFQNPKKINGSMMNYAINYITKIGEDVEQG
ncbi:hypothetical protein [Clostridium sardiniense]|uniref:hypothetical protein n=1 Tax=Clostridium sardiniense TaxID=29369 RepID=UPI003D351FF5